MSQNQFHKPEGGDGENGSPTITGIGSLFRGEREKMGLNHAQISEVTRLRPYILEALENEDWESLPSSVFVKGFIRSYARALELEEGMVMELYQKVSPFRPEPPRPLIAPVKSRKKTFIFLVILLVIMGSGYYLIQEAPVREMTVTRSDTDLSSGDNRVEVEEVQAPPQTEQLILDKKQEPVPSEDDQDNPGLPGKEALEEAGSSSLQAQELMLESLLTPEARDIDPEVQAGDMTLKAEVTERTWVRIFVDQQDPKEYIFRPGTRPEWKAREGFELLIGNARGIVFEFNGEKIDDLGDQGQVVRLKIPEDYERRHSQE